MRKLTQFELQLNQDIPIKGEFEGDDNSGKVVLFSHGFGVKRDSLGMFTELGDSLKDEFLVIRFDYNKIDKAQSATIVYPYSTQVKILDKVIAFIQKKFKPRELNIIAHSMGCLILGMLSPNNINKAILLAAPPTSQYKRMKEYFSKRPGTKFHEKGVSKIQRSDGSWTLVGSDFWPDTKNVNPPILFKKLVQKSKIYLVRAKQDEVIIDKSYGEMKKISGLEYLELAGNHNFTGKARKPWLQKIVGILKMKD